MNGGDQWIAVLVGGAVMLSLEVARRVMDFYLPKGWISKWAKEHAEKQDDDDDKETADE